jgi:hypothetical protein
MQQSTVPSFLTTLVSIQALVKGLSSCDTARVTDYENGCNGAVWTQQQTATAGVKYVIFRQRFISADNALKLYTMETERAKGS